MATLGGGGVLVSVGLVTKGEVISISWIVGDRQTDRS